MRSGARAPILWLQVVLVSNEGLMFNAKSRKIKGSKADLGLMLVKM